MAFLIDNLQYYLQVRRRRVFSLVLELQDAGMCSLNVPVGSVSAEFSCGLSGGGRAGVSVLSAAPADQLHPRL